MCFPAPILVCAALQRIEFICRPSVNADKYIERKNERELAHAVIVSRGYVPMKSGGLGKPLLKAAAPSVIVLETRHLIDSSGYRSDPDGGAPATRSWLSMTTGWKPSWMPRPSPGYLGRVASG